MVKTGMRRMKIHTGHVRQQRRGDGTVSAMTESPYTVIRSNVERNRAVQKGSLAASDVRRQIFSRKSSARTGRPSE